MIVIFEIMDKCLVALRRLKWLTGEEYTSILSIVDGGIRRGDKK